MKTAGIVLCGGRSSRMGRPKAWLPFDGEPMLTRAVRVVGEAVGVVVVVAAPDQDVPPLPEGTRLVRDNEEGFGPLAGFAAGLAALEGAADVVYLSSCDVPFLKAEFVGRVVSLIGSAAACVPRTDDRLHPLAAAYRLSVLPVVRGMIAAGRFRMTSLFDFVPTRVVEPHELAGADPDLASLRNVNTPAEYETAARADRPAEPPSDGSRKLYDGE